jgi:hypothetical protein
MKFSYQELMKSADAWNDSPVFMEYLKYLQVQGEALGMQGMVTFDFFINKGKISPLIFVPGRYATVNRELGPMHRNEVEKFGRTSEWASQVLSLTLLRKLGTKVVRNEAVIEGVCKEFPYIEYLKLARFYFEHIGPKVSVLDGHVTTDLERNILREIKEILPLPPASSASSAPRDLFSFLPKAVERQVTLKPAIKRPAQMATPKPPMVVEAPKPFIPQEVLNMGPEFAAQYVKAMMA